MMEEKIKWEVLKTLASNLQLSTETCYCEYEKYLGWEKYPMDDYKDLNRLIAYNMVLKGRVDDSGARANHPETPNYWDPNSPMSSQWYPYYGCQVYQCKDCSRYFLIYVEFGGHGVEKRCRLIRPDLMV